jgi:hypothetical protein
VEVVGELVDEFRKLEERHSQLERPGVRICDLLLGPPPGRARLADCLDEAVWQLGAELAARWEVDVELEALWTLAVRVQDMALDNADGSSSLEESLSTAVELLEGWVDATAANGVYWGTRSMLVTALSHISELDAKLELLGSGCNVDLMEDEVDALWTRVRATSNSLASHVLPSVAHIPPDGTRE